PHADANGYYTLTELPVGPLTFSTADAKGNTAYASGEIRQPGEVVTQNLVIQKRDVAGFGTVHITVRRSDQTDSAGNFIPVPNAHVGVWQQGYGLADGFTDSNVPVSKQDQNVVSIYDPATGRKGTARLPSQLTAGANNTMEIVLQTNQPQGIATLRVHLTSVSGEPIDDYDVIWPGYPPL